MNHIKYLENIINELKIAFRDKLPTDPLYTLRDVDVCVGQQKVIRYLENKLDGLTPDNLNNEQE
jgi:hypothetical protein